MFSDTTSVELWAYKYSVTNSLINCQYVEPQWVSEHMVSPELQPFATYTLNRYLPDLIAQAEIDMEILVSGAYLSNASTSIRLSGETEHDCGFNLSSRSF